MNKLNNYKFSKFVKVELNIMLKKCFIALMIIVNLSCGKNSKEITFDRSDFPKTTKLKSSIISLELDSLTLPISFYVTQDTLVLIENRKANPYLIDIYNLNTKKRISQLARIGEGPNEFLSTNVSIGASDSQNFCLFDIVKKSVGDVNNSYPFVIKTKLNLLRGLWHTEHDA